MRCEECDTGSFTRDQMVVDMSRKIFVGPCCQKGVSAPSMGSSEFEYGIQATNKKGILAFVNYKGFQLSYIRTPEQIRDWVDGVPQRPFQDIPATVFTQEQARA